MPLLAKERAIVAQATETVRNSSTALTVIAGLAVVIALAALVVAVARG